jgi:hypothetical protein
MKHLRVILYDEESKSIIEHECIPDGELELNDMVFAEVYLRVDELMVGSSTYKIMSRRFSIEGTKLIINVRLKT